MRRMSYWPIRVLTFCLLFFFAGQVRLGFAQRAATTLSGTVTDSTGAVVPGAKVTVTSQTTTFTRTATTNSVGAYLFPDLNPDVYDVSAEVPGFKKGVVTALKLYVGQPVVQDFRLEVGAITQEVSVEGAAPLLDRSTPQVATILTEAVISQLPLNGRNFLNLPRLSPSASYNKNSNTMDDVQINPTAQSFNVNGQRGDNNFFTLDGTLITEFQHGSNTMSPSVDAVEEFQVASANYSAASGTMAAAHLNLVTKSGTNAFHGGVYEFIRNDKLDARDFFAASKLPFRRNQFGGTIGGPVMLPRYSGKDKTFFFASYEGYRESKGSPLLGNYPTAAQLAGDLSTLATAAKPVIDPKTGAPFQGNKIPQDRMPAHLLNFLQTGIGNGPWIPVPNYAAPAPGYNYYTWDSRLYNNDQVIVKIDHQVGNKTFIYGRYAFNNGKKTNPNIRKENWHYIQTNRNNTVAFHIGRQIRPNFLWEFTYGYSRFHQNEYYTTAYVNNIVQMLGIEGLATFPSSWEGPAWGATGYSGFGQGGSAPRAWKPNTHEFHPAFSWMKGKHSMKFGSDFYRILHTFPEALVPTGSFGFDGRFTGYSLADFLLGLPNSVNISTTPFDAQFRYSILGGYFQDDWKATPHLTLNLGLRYEWMGIPRSNNKSLANLYLGPNNAAPVLYVSEGYGPITFEGQKQTLIDPALIAPVAGPKIAGSLGLPDTLLYRDDGNIGPRLGFAYSLPGASNTVLRGGYGLFYQRDTDNGFTDLSLNPPFIYSVIYTLNQANINQFDWFHPAKLGSAAPFGYYCMDPHYKAGRANQWNLTLEHSHWGALFSAAYVGVRSYHLPNMEYPNQARPGPGSTISRRLWAQPFFYWQNWNGVGNYHGLQTKFQRTFRRGFTIVSGFTWSKAMDDTGGNFVGEGERSSSMQDSYNRKADYGRASQDVPKRFFAAYVYELPFGRTKRFLNQGGVANVILGGWQVNGIVTIQSGNPVFIRQSCNRANTDAGTMRPDLVGNPNGLPSGRSHGEQVAKWFDTSAFVNYCPDLAGSGPFNFGNAGRNIVNGPGINSWDFALYKDFPLGAEQRHMQFRAEFFNFPNHPIFGQPGATAGTPQFGVISSTRADPRDIQFGLKINF